jgi:hypothetical protein
MPLAGPARRGHPITYPQKLFLKASVIMIVKHLHRVHELLSVLNETVYEMEQLGSFTPVPLRIHCLTQQVSTFVRMFLPKRTADAGRLQTCFIS